MKSSAYSFGVEAVWICVVIGMGAALYRFLGILDGPLVYDDAFITFRYSENLANGIGLVYNEGDRVLGTTTPLWTLILALLRYIGFDILRSAQIIAILADSGTCCLLFLMPLLRRHYLGLWAALIWMVYPPAINAAVGGMETSMFVFLNILSLYLIYKKAYNPSLALSSSLALLTRPEGVIIFVLSVLAILRHNANRMLALIISFIPPIAWAIFASLYFGSVVPLSIIAKRASADNTSSVIEIINGIISGHTMILLPFLALGLYFVFKHRGYRMPILWGSIYLSSYCIATPKMWVWYYLPMQISAIMLAALGIDSLCAILSTLTGRRKELALKIITRSGVVGVLLLSGYYYRPDNLGGENPEVKRYIALAEFAKNQTAEKEAILASDIGYLGYFSGRTIYDTWGLIWPPALEFNGTTAEKTPLIAEKSRPRIVVVPFRKTNVVHATSDAWFTANYKLIRIFTTPEQKVSDFDSAKIPDRWSSQYLVFRLNDKK